MKALAEKVQSEPTHRLRNDPFRSNGTTRLGCGSNADCQQVREMGFEPTNP
ncbi:MAG TPA: hypothetical protein VE130_01445 [Nitrososphaeraceae archaeon]|nr:hypothetical protein [Nitrososphaeraceae archaeon]